MGFFPLGTTPLLGCPSPGVGPSDAGIPPLGELCLDVSLMGFSPLGTTPQLEFFPLGVSPFAAGIFLLESDCELLCCWDFSHLELVIPLLGFFSLESDCELHSWDFSTQSQSFRY